MIPLNLGVTHLRHWLTTEVPPRVGAPTASLHALAILATVTILRESRANQGFRRRRQQYALQLRAAFFANWLLPAPEPTTECRVAACSNARAGGAHKPFHLPPHAFVARRVGPDASLRKHPSTLVEKRHEDRTSQTVRYQALSRQSAH